MTTLHDADAALAALAAAGTKLEEITERVIDARGRMSSDLQLEFIAAVGVHDDAERAYLAAVDALHGHVESPGFRAHADNAIDLTGGQH